MYEETRNAYKEIRDTYEGINNTYKRRWGVSGKGEIAKWRKEIRKKNYDSQY